MEIIFLITWKLLQLLLQLLQDEDEPEIRGNHRTLLLHLFVDIIQGHLPLHHEVGDHDGRGAADPLLAVHEGRFPVAEKLRRTTEDGLDIRVGIVPDFEVVVLDTRTAGTLRNSRTRLAQSNHLLDSLRLKPVRVFRRALCPEPHFLANEGHIRTGVLVLGLKFHSLDVVREGCEWRAPLILARHLEEILII